MAGLPTTIKHTISLARGKRGLRARHIFQNQRWVSRRTGRALAKGEHWVDPELIVNLFMVKVIGRARFNHRTCGGGVDGGGILSLGWFFWTCFISSRNESGDYIFSFTKLAHFESSLLRLRVFLIVRLILSHYLFLIYVYHLL